MNKNLYTGLQPILKWPGGKEKELKYILPNTPSFGRYFEPFVGGGSVYMGIDSPEYYINDFSQELITLYSCIASSNDSFFSLIAQINNSWKHAYLFFTNHQELVDTYLDYRQKLISELELKGKIHDFCINNKDEIVNILGILFQDLPCSLVEEIEKNLFRKMKRMFELENEKQLLPIEDVKDNIETAIKSAVYMNYRSLFNNMDILEKDKVLHCALFFFIRNYAYSGMFRYSSKGLFNVPYGGIAYNKKYLDKKINYYQSELLRSHFEKTHIYNYDFEDFFNLFEFNQNDFIFLDPPYDSEFSTYAQNSFDKNDQKRLANYLINKCKAKWMLIIKHTDFIYQLYCNKGLNIRAFEKEYIVSFMNRNDKKVTHLLITNY